MYPVLFNVGPRDESTLAFYLFPSLFTSYVFEKRQDEFGPIAVSAEKDLKC
jgi:hypothetical protein